MMAFLTGMLFVTHPLATQSVTYIVQRFASLATLFYLLSLILFVQGKLWQGNKNIPWFLFGGSIVCAVLGMLTKEIVFTLPFAIILYDYCFLKTTPWKLEIKDNSLIISFIMLVIFILLFFRNSSVSLLNIFNPVPPDSGIFLFHIDERIFSYPVQRHPDLYSPCSFCRLIRIWITIIRFPPVSFS